MYIYAQRLILREYAKDDFPLFRSVYTDEEVMKYAYATVYTKEDEIRSYFDKVLLDNTLGENREAYEFAVIERDSGEYIGSAGIEVEMKNQYGGFGEIGYFLRKPYWGQGFATEIAAALVSFCFLELKYHKVCASCNTLNIRSENIMKKIGMTKEGVLRKKRYKNTKWYDEARYGIMRDEWQNSIE